MIQINLKIKTSYGLFKKEIKVIIAHLLCGGYFISINAYRVWGKGERVGVQVFRREFYIYIHLNYVRVEILSCKKKKKKNQGVHRTF